MIVTERIGRKLKLIHPSGHTDFYDIDALTRLKVARQADVDQLNSEIAELDVHITELNKQ